MTFLYPGAIHIHSNHSDGTGTLEEIVKAAKKAGLPWIVISDHNSLKTKEGVYDGVTVIVANEITPGDDNHYIAFDVKSVTSQKIPPEDFIQDVKNQGGFGFIAHPDGKISRKNSCRCYRWANWNIKDFGGIEIWNFMSDWTDSYSEKNPFKAAYAYFFKNHVLNGPTQAALSWWDELNNQTPDIIPAIGGLDAHAMYIPNSCFKIKIFPYKSLFKSIVNIIHLDEPMPKDFPAQREAILSAIKEGRNIIMNSFWNRKSEKNQYPLFYINNGDRDFCAGQVCDFNTDLNLNVHLPMKAEIRVIKDGETILSEQSEALTLKITKKGKYRIEVYYKEKPWIFSNPIVVN